MSYFVKLSEHVGWILMLIKLHIAQDTYVIE
jgi:hypothetical protein